MRENMGLYRGKRIDNGEWVEGAYYKQTLYYGDPCEKHYIIISTESLGYDQAFEYYEVDPETVGQTGLTDKNGKKIFEGDIGRYKQTDGAKINDKPIICIGKVVYNEKTASFAVDSKDEIGAKNYDYFPIKDFEIIGTIHDNPELLKGGEE
jgi:uncharacterized phage protein (TIGR01671 family)